MPRFHTPYTTTIVLCGALITFSNGVYAQTNSAASPESSSLPPGSSAMVQTSRRGMMMDQVQAQYGAPSAQLPAIGEPPITRWVYNDFTVYFEHQYVIHAVPSQ